MYVFFFFNDTATTEIYTLSLHDALPIFLASFETVRPDQKGHRPFFVCNLISQIAHDTWGQVGADRKRVGDRKSTRLNSSHGYISYAVFCLKKKNNDANIVRAHV